MRAMATLAILYSSRRAPARCFACLLIERVHVRASAPLSLDQWASGPVGHWSIGAASYSIRVSLFADERLPGPASAPLFVHSPACGPEGERRRSLRRGCIALLHRGAFRDGVLVLKHGAYACCIYASSKDNTVH